MGNFFTKKSKHKPECPQVSSTIITITRLRETISNMEKRECLLTKKMKRVFNLARQEKKAGNRALAIYHMRRKRLYENEINKISTMKLNLEQQIFTLESAQTNIHTITAMQAGQETMKTLASEHTIEIVEELRETIEEQHENTHEINTLIGEPMGAMIDDDELEQEFNDLLKDEMTTELEKTHTSKEEVFPNVPNHIPTMTTIEEENELEELEREMTLA